MYSMKRPGMNFSLVEVSIYVLNYLVYLKFWEPQYMYEIQGNLKQSLLNKQYNYFNYQIQILVAPRSYNRVLEYASYD